MIIKNKRAIIVSHPRLKRIRDSFRQVWLFASHMRIMDIIRRSQLVKDINLYHSFLSERQELERLEINSICRCPACRKTTKDMIFNSILNKWFCIDCYEEIQNEYQIRKHLRRLALDTDDYDVHFYESFDKS